ncbi:MAG: hypothetical protein ACK4ZJ_00050 [Allorhizobium sp.]
MILSGISRGRVRAVLFGLGMATALATGAQALDTSQLSAMSAEQIAEEAAYVHPAQLYVVATHYASRGEGALAAQWLYAAQLRYRFLVEAGGEAARGEGIKLGYLDVITGDPIRLYIAGNVDEWIGAMQWALDWDDASTNTTTSKSEHAEVLQKIRLGLESMITAVDHNRDMILLDRQARQQEIR